ncbi:MAG: ATP-dependent 6-phosphofructokinase [Gemmataceae bacterium]
MIRQEDLEVEKLAEGRLPSPIALPSARAGRKGHFVSDSSRVRFEVKSSESDDLSFEEAGPREKVFFKPEETTAAIVTCGGLAPGLNNVIRSVYHELVDNYGVKRVLGIRNGYKGLNPQFGLKPINLTEDYVDSIDMLGGTVLGSSRGPQEVSVMADFLESQQIDILFCLGGDGTQRGAYNLHQEINRRKRPIAIVGIPKTIDNDVPYVQMSFGFTTALEKAAEVIRGIHVEARGVINGVGLVKLMGRNAGFIAAGASVISQEVDFTLVPEVPFPLEGENGFLSALEDRLRRRAHAVIVVAEGAGQHLFNQTETERDASGNIRHQDIGVLLRERIKEHFHNVNITANVRYVDPSYSIRSVPANAYDRFLSDQMARHAAHAAMAGKTGMLVGSMHGLFINIPIPVVVAGEKKVEVEGDLWRAVLTSTRQPHWSYLQGIDHET